MLLMKCYLTAAMLSLQLLWPTQMHTLHAQGNTNLHFRSVHRTWLKMSILQSTAAHHCPLLPCCCCCFLADCCSRMLRRAVALMQRPYSSCWVQQQAPTRQAPWPAVDGRAAGSGSTALLLPPLHAWRPGPPAGLSNGLLPLLARQEVGAAGAQTYPPTYPFLKYSSRLCCTGKCKPTVAHDHQPEVSSQQLHACKQRTAAGQVPPSCASQWYLHHHTHHTHHILVCTAAGPRHTASTSHPAQLTWHLCWPQAAASRPALSAHQPAALLTHCCQRTCTTRWAGQGLLSSDLIV
jgi:hypothetical protein